MPIFDSLKIDNTQYDVDLHSATFAFPSGEYKEYCKAMTIPGFRGDYNNRQFFFILYGRHCPCGLYMVKYQHTSHGTGTLANVNFEITCYGNFAYTSKADIIFQKEQTGTSFVLNIYSHCYDYGSLNMWIAPRNITVYDYSTAEWVTADEIPNQIPVKYVVSSDDMRVNGTTLKLG